MLISGVMALARFLLATSLLLLPLLILASAGKYYSYSPNLEDDHSRKHQPQDYTYSPKSKSEDKFKIEDYRTYGSTSYIDNSKSRDDRYAGFNPEIYNPKPKDNSDIYKSKSKPEYDKYSKSGSVGIEGLVYCKSGSKYYPLQGAVARITCVSFDLHGDERADPFNIYSDASDENGYFFARFSPSQLKYGLKFAECKAYLEKSPMDEDCNVPTDVNKGTSGAPLSSYSYKILRNKKIKLYSLNTFFFTSPSQPNQS